MKKLFVTFLCAILLFASNIPFAVSVDASTRIADINTNSTKDTAAKWAVNKGVIKLASNNRFNKTKLLTERELLAAFAKLDRNYVYSTSNYDMMYNHYSELHIPLKGALDRAKRNSSLTRGEFAVIYAAMFGLDLSEKQAVRYLYLNEITTGTTKSKTYESYNPTNKLTRGDAAVFLYRMNAKKKNLRVEGLSAKAKGADNGKITLPPNFSKNDSGDVELELGKPDNNDSPGNLEESLKEVQKIEVEKDALIANGVDVTRVSIDLKNSYGEDIDYLQSLQFKVTSKYNNSDLVGQNADADSYVKITTNPRAALTSTVYSDGGDLTFYVTAPKATKSYRDVIYVELINNNNPAYASFKNKRIEIPIQYAPQAELRVSYDVYDASAADYVGGGDEEEEKWALLPSTIPPGVVNIYDLDIDEKTFKVTTSNAATGGLVVGYEGAKLTIAGYEISEYLFESIAKQYFENNDLNMSTLSVIMSADINGNAAYDLPFSIVPNKFTSMFSTGDPEQYAVIAYLVSLLPSSINEFSMAYYESVKKIQSMFFAIPESAINNVPGLTALKTPISGLVQLADTEYQNQIDAQKEKETSHTKVKVSLVAPGGQIITNYRGPVVIEYNGVRQQVMFNTNTSNPLNNTGHAGTAVAIFDDLKYGESEVKVTLPYYAADTRYEKLINNLYDKTQTETIIATLPLDDRACITYSEVAVIVDASASMNKYDPSNEIGRKAKELITKMEADPTIAVSYNSKATLEKKGNKDQVLSLDQGLYSLQNRGGATSMKEGVRTAINNFSSIGDRSVKKAIIIISDGFTRTSDAAEIINLANNNDIEVHTITLGKQTDSNFELMKRLANETDGSYAHATGADQLAAAFQLIYDKVVCSFGSSTEVCKDINMFEQASVVIGMSKVDMYSVLNANCTHIKAVKVRFSAEGGDFLIDLDPLGNNFFDLSYPKYNLTNFDLRSEVEFIAYDAEGKEVNSKKVRVQQ